MAEWLPSRDIPQFLGKYWYIVSYNITEKIKRGDDDSIDFDKMLNALKFDLRNDGVHFCRRLVLVGKFYSKYIHRWKLVPLVVIYNLTAPCNVERTRTFSEKTISIDDELTFSMASISLLSSLNHIFLSPSIDRKQ